MLMHACVLMKYLHRLSDPHTSTHLGFSHITEKNERKERLDYELVWLTPLHFNNHMQMNLVSCSNMEAHNVASLLRLTYSKPQHDSNQLLRISNLNFNALLSQQISYSYLFFISRFS